MALRSSVELENVASFDISVKLEVGAPLARYIQAIKDDEEEEPVVFGPNAALTDFGSGLKLQTVDELDHPGFRMPEGDETIKTSIPPGMSMPHDERYTGPGKNNTLRVNHCAGIGERFTLPIANGADGIGNLKCGQHSVVNRKPNFKAVSYNEKPMHRFYRI
ncbi:hypothetical protein ACFE04_003326 [Oxalis oulophora]